VSAAFIVNVLSFSAVIVVITRWNRPTQRRAAPAETLGGATVAALRYVRHSPAICTLLLRTGSAMFFATAILALLPVVAQRVGGSPLGYGILLGFFGSGAVLGAVMMPVLRARFSVEATVSGALAILSISLLAAGVLRSLGALSPIMICAGAAWMIFISWHNTMVQQMAPEWVRARVLAVFVLVFQGGLALGSVVWGLAAESRGITFALIVAGAGTAAVILLRFYASLPNVDIDLSPWSHWRALAPIVQLGYGLNDDPVLITVEYEVTPENCVAFVKAVHRLGRLRRRDGASRWGIFRDTESTDKYIETFIVNSWAEHLRQHERSVRADRLVEDAVGRVSHDSAIVRHFLYADDER